MIGSQILETHECAQELRGAFAMSYGGESGAEAHSLLGTLLPCLTLALGKCPIKIEFKRCLPFTLESPYYHSLPRAPARRVITLHSHKYPILSVLFTLVNLTGTHGTFHRPQLPVLRLYVQEEEEEEKVWETKASEEGLLRRTLLRSYHGRHKKTQPRIQAS